MGRRRHFYGPLFHHQIDYSGKWIQSIIQKISSLSCVFEGVSDSLHNGINVKDTSKLTQLGDVIAKFMVGSYITKNIIKSNDVTGERFTVSHVINIVLFSIDEKEECNIINKAVIESIVSILNHPHFQGCNCIDDIHRKLSSVEDLNKRYKESDSSSEEEEEEEEVEKGFQGEIQRFKNIFLD